MLHRFLQEEESVLSYKANLTVLSPPRLRYQHNGQIGEIVERAKPEAFSYWWLTFQLICNCGVHEASGARFCQWFDQGCESVTVCLFALLLTSIFSGTCAVFVNDSVDTCMNSSPRPKTSGRFAGASFLSVQNERSGEYAANHRIKTTLTVRLKKYVDTWQVKKTKIYSNP